MEKSKGLNLNRFYQENPDLTGFIFSLIWNFLAYWEGLAIYNLPGTNNIPIWDFFFRPVHYVIAIFFIPLLSGGHQTVLAVPGYQKGFSWLDIVSFLVSIFVFFWLFRAFVKWMFKEKA